jgi:DNA (cytosine-5)-methyltransferase 3A
MIVLSLFDGMSCGRIALDRLGITPSKYFAAEIDRDAIKVSNANYPCIIRIGDVTKVSFKDGILYTENGEYFVGAIDLLIGGSPCQDFSVANKDRMGLEGSKSKLFFEYLRIKNEVKPRNFLLENVRMKKESKKLLDDYLGVIGKEINSALVSFQHRNRIYWTNLDIPSIADKNISFQDYKQVSNISQYKVKRTPSRERMWNNGKVGKNRSVCKNITYADKVQCLTLNKIEHLTVV